MSSKRVQLAASFFLLIFSASAQIAVRVDRAAKLFAQPTERAMVISEVGGRASFRALEQSPDKQWIFISDGLRYGWIRKIFVRTVDEASAAVSEVTAGAVPADSKESIVVENAPPDADLPAEDDVEDPKDNVAPEEESLGEAEGPQSKVFLVKQPGNFYETPKKNSARFGKLEPGDQVELLESSESQKWARVRLVETGEEGWVPRERIGRKVPRSELHEMDAISNRNWHLGAYGVVAPTPWSFGAEFVLRRSFTSLSIGQTPLEIGIGGGFNLGTLEETDLGSNINVTYLDLRMMIHWEPKLTSRLTLPIELGGLYKYGVIETDLSQTAFESVETRIKETEIGGYIGIGLGFFLTDYFSAEVMPQVQLTSSVDLILNAGLALHF